MFFRFIRVWVLLFMMIIGDVYANESNATYSKVFTSHNNIYDIGAAIFSPNGRYLISGANELVIWDLEDNKEFKHVFADSEGTITSLSFSPDGRYLLSSGYSKIIKLWDTKTWKVIKRLYHNTASNYLAFSLDMQYVLSGNTHRYIDWDDESKQYIQNSETWNYKLWDISSEKKLKDFNHTVDKDILAQFGIENKDIKPLRVSMAIDEQRKMHKQIEKMQKVRNDFERLRFTTYSPDKKYIIALHFIAIQGSYLGALVLWDAQTMQIVKEFKASPISAHLPEDNIFSKLPYGIKMGKKIPDKILDMNLPIHDIGDGLLGYKIPEKFQLVYGKDNHKVSKIYYGYNSKYDTYRQTVPRMLREAGLWVCSVNNPGTSYEDVLQIIKNNKISDLESNKTAGKIFFKVDNDKQYLFAFNEVTDLEDGYCKKGGLFAIVVSEVEENENSTSTTRIKKATIVRNKQISQTCKSQSLQYNDVNGQTTLICQ